MKLIIEVEVPENASPIEKEDAMLHAINHNLWREVHHRDELHRDVTLDGKCGSCKHFKPMEIGGSKCYGKCEMGRVMGQRTRPACLAYEVKHD